MESIKPKSFFYSLIQSHQNMMRAEFLVFLELCELVKLALLSRKLNKIVDPNRQYIQTHYSQFIDGYSIKWLDPKKRGKYQLKRHFTIILSV